MSFYSFNDNYEEPPIYKAGHLEKLSDERLMAEMDWAYGSQASCVDNGGSDDQSYRSEQRCNLVQAELKRRGIEDAYWSRDE